MRSPAGNSVLIRHGGYEAEIVEVGAGLRALRRDGHDVIAGYGPDEMCTSGRGQLLVPWPNRIQDGRYDFDGSSHQLALTEPAKRNASHGLARWASWALEDRTASSARCSLRLNPQPGYPFSLDLTASYSLDDDGLRVEIGATNVGVCAAPYGHGAHPYLTVGRRLDECELVLPASTRAETDDRGIPDDAVPVDRGPYDFRLPRLVGDTSFDHPYGGLAASMDGLAWTTLRDPDTGRTSTLWVDSSYAWLQVFSGDHLGPRAREALAVEPMTCPPNAFRSGLDLLVLQPGDTHVGVFGLA